MTDRHLHVTSESESGSSLESAADELKRRRAQFTRLIFVGQRLLAVGGFVLGLRRARKQGIARPAIPVAAALLVAVDLWAAYHLEELDSGHQDAVGLTGPADTSVGTAGIANRATVAGVARRLVTP